MRIRSGNFLIITESKK
jgi:hypothetical protein